MIHTAKRLERVDEYYFSKKLAEVKSLNTPDFPVINLGIGSPDLPPLAEVSEKLWATARQTTTHGYQSYRGTPSFRNAIAAFYKRVYRVDLDASNMILPLMGSKEGIMHIAMAFLDEGDQVLIPNPGYPTYASACALAGGTIVSYDLLEENNWAINLERLEQQDLSAVKLMFVNYPHMPTGRKATYEQLKRLVDLARRNHFLLVNDNPYSLILNDTPMSILAVEGAKEVALELNSLSKSHNMAGWRVGWVAGNSQWIDAVLRVKSNMDSGMFLGIQEAATVALALNDQWFTSLNSVYKERRRAAEEILALLGCKTDNDQSGLFLWAKVPDHVTSVESWIDDILYTTKVFITPGFIFGSNGGRFVRISLCADVDTIKKAKSRLEVFIQRKAADVEFNTK